jgi:GT2 family glycosyltransferase
VSELRVSVVIPVFNGGPELQDCLDAIMASSYPVHECILVDDASTDGETGRVAERHDATVIYLKEQLGPANARNIGVQKASGDLIFFVDADVVVHTNTLAVAARVLQNEPETAAVFGSYDNEPGHHSFISQYRNLFHHYVHQTSRSEASTFWTGCGVIRREIFVEMKGFKKNYERPSIEDIELGSRLCHSGYRIRLEKNMLCKHLKHWKFWNLVKTDIFQRGVPWMVLLMRNRHVPTDLNLSNNSRIATALAGILPLVLLALLLTGRAAALFPTAAFLLTATACGVFSGKRGGSFLTILTLAISAPLLAYLLAPDPLAVIPMILILLIVFTHLSFYRFLVKSRNSAFAFAAVPLQVIFFLSCAVAGVLGLLIYFFDTVRAPAAH